MKLESFEALIEQLERIPSIGKKSASKIAFNLAFEDKMLALNLAHRIEEAVARIHKCSICGGLAEGEICHICDDESRIFSGNLCIVGNAKDIVTIEESGAFYGSYFVADSIKSIDFGILIENVKKYKIKEILFAFSPSLANETIMLYIEDKLQFLDLKFYKIAHGIPTGVGLENVDKMSLFRAVESKVKI